MQKRVIRYSDGVVYSYLILARRVRWLGVALATVERLSEERHAVDARHFLFTGDESKAMTKAEMRLDARHPGLRKSCSPVIPSIEPVAVEPEARVRELEDTVRGYRLFLSQVLEIARAIPEPTSIGPARASWEKLQRLLAEVEKFLAQESERITSLDKSPA